MNDTDDIVIFRCTDCGKTSTSIGSLHAHCEKHHGIFGIQLPWRIGDFEALMEYTEVLRVTDYEHVDIDDVEVQS
jgi:hypothetical protein